MKEYKYFTLNELCKSDTANKYGINNIPTDSETLDNMDYIMDRLDEIREGYGKPIIITSGYRSKELNDRVGGEKTSFHLKGLAVDIQWDEDLILYIIENYSFDKLIRESKGNTKWIHLQFQKDKNKDRNITLSIKVRK